MASRFEQLRDDNEIIERRYHRAEKTGNIREMYAARTDYQSNIDRQKDELNKMDKSSPEYASAKQNVDEQQRKAYGMEYRSKDGNDMDKLQSEMKDLERENRGLSMEMDKAVAKGDTRKYDDLSRRFETNVKAQEGISSQLKTNGIDHDNTTERQKIEKRNLDMDMRDKMDEKIKQAESKGKQPNERDLADYQKYADISKAEERQALEEIDNRKLKQMESYGISSEQIEKERQQMEQSRNRLLGEEKQK